MSKTTARCQDVPNVHVTQKGAGEVQKEALSSMTTMVYLEALKNIYQVERYMKKHHNQKPVESPVKPGDLILMVNHTAKAFEPKYKKETYMVVKVNGNQVDIRDYRGNILMVQITDVKKTTLTNEVADI